MKLHNNFKKNSFIIYGLRPPGLIPPPLHKKISYPLGDRVKILIKITWSAGGGIKIINLILMGASLDIWGE